MQYQILQYSLREAPSSRGSASQVIRAAVGLSGCRVPFSGDNVSVKNWSELPIFENGNWRPIPNFFLYELMPLSKGVPPMFWKFTFALMGDVLRQRQVAPKVYTYDLVCKKALSKWVALHGVNKAAAIDFNHAYRASGLFEIKWGFKDIELMESQPTEYLYRPEATEEDWRAFIKGLSLAYRISKGWHMARRRVLKEGWRPELRPYQKPLDEKIDSGLAFRLLMAVEIDNARMRADLKSVNEVLIGELLDQGAGKRNEDGSFYYRYATTDRLGLNNTQ